MSEKVEKLSKRRQNKHMKIEDEIFELKISNENDC